MSSDVLDPTNIPGTLAELAMPIDSLQHYGGNARQGDLGVIMESLEAHGQYRPVVVNIGNFTGRQNEILAGNHTVMGARELGWTRVAVTFVDVDDDQAKRILLVDNRANDLGGYDDEALAELLQSVETFEGTGFGQEDLDKLLELISDEPEELEVPEDDESSLVSISLKVPKELHKRFFDALAAQDGDDDADRLEMLLARKGR